MKLDEDKTKITRASKGYRFLGFEIRLNKKKASTTSNKKRIHLII